MPTGESERTIAKCRACSSAYAAKEWTDGTIQPIGTRNGCRCGSTEFQALETADSPGLREDPID